MRADPSSVSSMKIQVRKSITRGGWIVFCPQCGQRSNPQPNVQRALRASDGHAFLHNLSEGTDHADHN